MLAERGKKYKQSGCKTNVWTSQLRSPILPYLLLLHRIFAVIAAPTAILPAIFAWRKTSKSPPTLRGSLQLTDHPRFGLLCNSAVLASPTLPRPSNPIQPKFAVVLPLLAPRGCPYAAQVAAQSHIGDGALTRGCSTTRLLSLPCHEPAAECRLALALSLSPDALCLHPPTLHLPVGRENNGAP
jgi:hypothetical protein